MYITSFFNTEMVEPRGVLAQALALLGLPEDGAVTVVELVKSYR